MNASEFNTVFWKEWKEIVMERSGGAGSYRPLIMIGVLGVFLPFRMAPERFFSPFPVPRFGCRGVRVKSLPTTD